MLPYLVKGIFRRILQEPGIYYLSIYISEMKDIGRCYSSNAVCVGLAVN